MAIPDFGTGLNCTTDLPKIFTYASGYLNLGNNLLRRLQTPRGSLPWDLDCGWDVRQLFRGTFSVREVVAAESEISAECEKDERVASASATVTYIPQSQTLIISVLVATAQGPTFTLVLSVDALNVSLLRIVAP